MVQVVEFVEKRNYKNNGNTKCESDTKCVEQTKKMTIKTQQIIEKYTNSDLFGNDRIKKFKNDFIKATKKSSFTVKKKSFSFDQKLKNGVLHVNKNVLKNLK